MGREEQISVVSNLLEEAAHAHHQAFLATDGADPDWAIWYADHLSKSLPAALGVSLTRTHLVCLLSALAEEHTVRGGENEPWAAFYARDLVSRFVPEADERLSLYVMPGCPFCRTVLETIDRLRLKVELRDVVADENARRDLMAARGRLTVPVLRCTSSGVDRWMPESADIVAYLKRRFGAGVS